jgi:hypothetical protein
MAQFQGGIFRLPTLDRISLFASGAGSGLLVAVNAPITGAAHALQERVRRLISGRSSPQRAPPVRTSRQHHGGKGLLPFSFSHAALCSSQKCQGADDNQPGRLPETTTPDAMKWVSALKEKTRVHSKPIETLPDSADVHQDASGGTRIEEHLSAPVQRLSQSMALLCCWRQFCFISGGGDF